MFALLLLTASVGAPDSIYAEIGAANPRPEVTAAPARKAAAAWQLTFVKTPLVDLGVDGVQSTRDDSRALPAGWTSGVYVKGPQREVIVSDDISPRLLLSFVEKLVYPPKTTQAQAAPPRTATADCPDGNCPSGNCGTTTYTQPGRIFRFRPY